MSGFVMSVLEPVFLHLCSCFGGEVNYVRNLEKNLVALEDTMKVLRARRADVLTKLQRQESKGLQRLNEVEVWLTSVENIQNQVYELLLPRRDELERLCLCTKNLSSSHSYGKRVFEMLKEVEDLKSEGVFGVVAGPPSNGCKVVFSTRSREVCGQMGVDDPMEVKCLESDEAWDFFRSNVGKITLESDPDILEVACQVARECRGLLLRMVSEGSMAWRISDVEEYKLAQQPHEKSMKDPLFKGVPKQE